MKQMIYIAGHADVRVRHVAFCADCDEDMAPAPRFDWQAERDAWIRRHATDTPATRPTRQRKYG